MKTTIRKIGNSEGIIIPKEILERMGLRVGDNIDLSEEAGKLVLKPLDDDFNRQLEHAERFMDRYKVALKKLAE
ncbi:AbrB/MazE/SpoVT family DNA-binding domain-containing protein [Neorhizobium sp. DAR64872/K0K18]|uniref:AbrB/MazE/SpoVT family DNA-binding domain-containing protein n=1 Tax=Neorhizobium sp. DAR64872/K0K18 TaxID=3421958 RepID=UPI003D2D88F1